MHLAIICALFMLLFSPAKANHVAQVKAYLNQREKIPKLYMPQQVLIDSEADIVVQAPGAKRVVLLGSEPFNGTGVHLSDKVHLRLADNYRELEARDLNNGESTVRFKLKLDKETYKHLVNKAYFLEALVIYDFYGEETTQRALIFGANANYIGYNAFRITEPGKDYSGVANFARSFFPSLGMNAGPN